MGTTGGTYSAHIFRPVMPREREITDVFVLIIPTGQLISRLIISRESSVIH